MNNKIIKSMLLTIIAVMILAMIGNTIQNIALAQSNSNETSNNQTGAKITGKPETTIINKTTIPAEQTTVTVNKTTSSLDKSALQPLQNQTMAEAPVDLSAFKNKTVLQPTGEAQTTMVNKTTVPFEQTTVEGMNHTQGQQQQQGNQTETQGQQQQQGNQTETQGQQQSGQVQQQQPKQGSQSSGPLEKIGETITGAFK